MKKCLLVAVIGLLAAATGSAQYKLDSAFERLKSSLVAVDKDPKMFISQGGLNVFLQKKTMQYLTGAADLSLARFYASYTNEENRLNLGFNFSLTNKSTQLLKLVVNPQFEADTKNNFATLWEKGKTQKNIRAGLKLTFFPKIGSLNHWTQDSKAYRKDDLKILRKKKFDELKEAYLAQEKSYITPVTTLSGEQVLAKMPAVPENTNKKDRQQQKKANELFEAVAIAEADYIIKENAYAWFQTGWFSAWAFVPLSKAEQYISSNPTEHFQPVNYKSWELNAQYTHMLESVRKGTIYLSASVKYFQNNSANAGLMTDVDYHNYLSFPGIDTLNLALLDDNKGYIGAYKTFKTTQLGFHAVYQLPVDGAVRPGVSFKLEKNIGKEYDPLNLSFGVPLSIQGKEKGTPINIEFQFRLKDVSNYADKLEHEPKKIIGLSLGVPFVKLYK